MNRKSDEEGAAEAKITKGLEPQNIRNILEEKLCKYGSVEFMANLAMKEMYAQSSVLHDPTNPISENPFVIYSAGLFLSKNSLGSGEPHPNQLDEFIEILSKYFDSLRLSYMFSDKANSKLSNITAFISQQEKISDDASPNIYPHQKDDYYRRVFCPLDNYFISELGFSVQDAINFANIFLVRLDKHMEYRYRAIGEKCMEIKKLAEHDSILQKICVENKMTPEQICSIFTNRMLCVNSSSILTINVDDYCKQQDIKNEDAFRK